MSTTIINLNDRVILDKQSFKIYDTYKQAKPFCNQVIEDIEVNTDDYLIINKGSKPVIVVTPSGEEALEMSVLSIKCVLKCRQEKE